MDSEGSKCLGEGPRLWSSEGSIPSLSEKPVTGVYSFLHRRKMGLAALIIQTVTLESSILCFPVMHAGSRKEEVRL